MHQKVYNAVKFTQAYKRKSRNIKFVNVYLVINGEFVLCMFKKRSQIKGGGGGDKQTINNLIFQA